MAERRCTICSAELERNQTKLCSADDCKAEYNRRRQRDYNRRKKRLHRNAIALQSDGSDIDISNPPVRYKGGKWRIASWIIDHFPKHTSYVEPFCGGASVFFQKQPSEIETLNDLNGNVVTFFDMLRANPEELIRLIQLTPYSRDEWERAHHPPVDDPMEIARAFYIRSRMSFDSGEGRWKSGFRYMVNNRRGKTVTMEWNDVNMLWAAARRLKDAQIENTDALTIIQRFDSKDTLFYVDPPYMFDTRHSNEEYYTHEMTDQQHIELAIELKNCEGMVILSGYDHPLYRDLYSGWTKLSKKTRTNGGNNATESIWINPSANSINQLPLFQSIESE